MRLVSPARLLLQDLFVYTSSSLGLFLWVSFLRLFDFRFFPFFFRSNTHRLIYYRLTNLLRPLRYISRPSPSSPPSLPHRTGTDAPLIASFSSFFKTFSLVFIFRYPRPRASFFMVIMAACWFLSSLFFDGLLFFHVLFITYQMKRGWGEDAWPVEWMGSGMGCPLGIYIKSYMYPLLRPTDRPTGVVWWWWSDGCCL